MAILKIPENFSIINDKPIERSLSLHIKENGQLDKVEIKKLKEMIHSFNGKYYERRI